VGVLNLLTQESESASDKKQLDSVSLVSAHNRINLILIPFFRFRAKLFKRFVLQLRSKGCCWFDFPSGTTA